MSADERQAALYTTPALSRINAYVCGLCLTGVGSDCHVPGCVFWMHDVPTEDTAEALRSSVEATS